MNDFLNYGEYNPDLCEYNPRSVELEKELRRLVERVENSEMSILQMIMKRLMLLPNV